ncbi:MAG TPA: 2-dehydro-3-deoxyphosphogluconate aldolase [Thermoanaerobaculia bacterium]|nr:2-dehydro-3-deoxyphosphogluconate aldolase [Thermoanaerobaculia bacterium]
METPAHSPEIEALVAAFARERACAILRCADREVGRQAMDAALAGGFRLVEVTLTTPGALALIAELATRPGVTVGAGTVLTVDQAEAAVAHGARFVVSPVTDFAVIQRAAELGVAALPGGHTPSELLAAHRAGAPLLKLFPAPAGGPAWLRSLLAPLPFLKVVPTNGTDPDNAADWLAAGAYALGFGATLFQPDDLRQRRFDRVEERARLILSRVRPQPAAVGS